MANVRVTVPPKISRTPGDITGMTVNTFGLSKLQAGITGETLLPIVVDAAQLALADAQENWPVLTGASRDTITLNTLEVGDKHVRVALQVGGAALIADPRNKSHIDYAPFVEFNGSPAGRGQNTILSAVVSNEKEMRDRIHAGVARLIEELTQ